MKEFAYFLRWLFTEKVVGTVVQLFKWLWAFAKMLKQDSDLRRAFLASVWFIMLIAVWIVCVWVFNQPLAQGFALAVFLAVVPLLMYIPYQVVKWVFWTKPRGLWQEFQADKRRLFNTLKD